MEQCRCWSFAAIVGNGSHASSHCSLVDAGSVFGSLAGLPHFPMSFTSISADFGLSFRGFVEPPDEGTMQSQFRTLPREMNVFFHILGMSSFQLTNSIIFQRGRSTTSQINNGDFTVKNDKAMIMVISRYHDDTGDISWSTLGRKFDRKLLLRPLSRTLCQIKYQKVRWNVWKKFGSCK